MHELLYPHAERTLQAYKQTSHENLRSHETSDLARLHKSVTDFLDSQPTTLEEDEGLLAEDHSDTSFVTALQYRIQYKRDLDMASDLLADIITERTEHSERSEL